MPTLIKPHVRLSKEDIMAVELAAGPVRLQPPIGSANPSGDPLNAPHGVPSVIAEVNPNIVELSMKITYNLENPTDMVNFAKAVASSNQTLKFKPIYEEDSIRGTYVAGSQLWLNGELFAEKRVEGINANASWDQLALWAEEFRASPSENKPPSYIRGPNSSIAQYKRGQIGKDEKIEMRRLHKEEDMKVKDIAKKFRRKIEAVDDIILNIS